MPNCPFCSIDPGRKCIEREYAIAFAVVSPVLEGHTLLQSAVWGLVAEIREQLLSELKPDGFSIGINDGFAAAPITEHAHVHVIPRRTGTSPDLGPAFGGCPTINLTAGTNSPYFVQPGT